MKQLLAAVFLLLVIGIAGFLYRNALERPIVPAPGAPGGAVACTLEAKVCPDGTSVGRTGPNCTFTPCPLPNFEDNALAISFVIPSGFTATTTLPGSDASLKDTFVRSSGTGGVDDTILVRDYPIPADQTTQQVILANTTYGASGKQAAAMSEFAAKTIGTYTFYSVVIERFEGQVQSAYYLPRTHDVLRFDVTDHNVTNWTDTTLNVETLPEHAALLHLLGTLQAAS